jgi:hypothetical protein
MGRRNLRASLNAFVRSVTECRHLAVDAHAWASPKPGHKRAMISPQRRDSMMELAFLRSFLAWETFLEESFVLYLGGQKPPKGRAPFRYSFPPNLGAAMEWVVPEGQDYATWTVASRVTERAQRFFRHGQPYAPVLRSNQSALDESRTLRNAIAHASASAQSKFETLVRNKIGALPPKLTVGGFLGMVVPSSTPPRSYLDHYLEKIEFAAHQVVPV